MGDAPDHPFTESYFLIGLKPGFEFRILENTKISPYWDFEFCYVNKSSKSNYGDNDDNGTSIDGAWRGYETGYTYSSNYYGGYYQYTSTNYLNKRAYYTLGTNALIGVDYFVMKHLYLGVEIGLGYEMKNLKKSQKKMKILVMRISSQVIKLLLLDSITITL